MSPRTLRSVLFASLVCLSWISGCVGDDEGGPAGTTGTDDTGTANGTNVSKTGNGTDNEPPTAEIAFTVEDEANHTYRFDGSNSSDPEAGNLTFAWDFGDNATSSNMTESHTFDTGNQSGEVVFNVTLVVTDDGGLRATAMATVNFTAGPPSGSPHHTETFADDGLLLVGTATEPAIEGVDYRDHTITIVDVGNDSVPLIANEARIVLDGGGAGGVDMDLYFLGPDGAELGSSTTSTADEAITHSQPMPPGDYTIRVYFWAGAAGSYDVTAEVDYLVA